MTRSNILPFIAILGFGYSNCLHGQNDLWKEIPIAGRVVNDVAIEDGGIIHVCGKARAHIDDTRFWLGSFNGTGWPLLKAPQSSDGECLKILPDHKGGLIFAANERRSLQIFDIENPNLNTKFTGLVGHINGDGVLTRFSPINTQIQSASAPTSGSLSSLSVTADGTPIIGGNLREELEGFAPHIGLGYNSKGFVTACKPSGWRIELEGLQFSRVSMVTIGKDGTVYFSGWARGLVRFDNLPKQVVDRSRPFVGAIGPSGRIKWINTFGDEITSWRAFSVGTTTDNSVFVAGLSAKILKEGTPANIHAGSRSLFQAVFNSDGEFIRMTESTGTGRVGFGGISVLPNGECFVAGSIGGNCNFGDISVDSPVDSAFLLHMNKDGKFKEVITMKSTFYSFGGGVRVSDDGRILFWGQHYEDARFGNISLNGEGTFLLIKTLKD